MNLLKIKNTATKISSFLIPNYFRFLALFLFCFLFSAALLAQNTDTLSIAIDTTQSQKKFTLFQKNGVKKDRPLQKFLEKKDGLPNPRTSFILSVAVPGAGQIYNGRWWKVPFVYGALVGLYFTIDYNTDGYLRYRTAYKRKQAGLDHFYTDTRLDDAATLKNRRDAFDKNRQLSYVGIVVIWLINGIEAFTDAHLLNFDVDDDLSFKIKPVLENLPDQGTLTGIGVVYTFK